MILVLEEGKVLLPLLEGKSTCTTAKIVNKVVLVLLFRGQKLTKKVKESAAEIIFIYILKYFRYLYQSLSITMVRYRIAERKIQRVRDRATARRRRMNFALYYRMSNQCTG